MNSYFKNEVLKSLWTKYLVVDISKASDEMLRECIVDAVKNI